MDNEVVRSWKDPQSADHHVDNPVEAAMTETGGLASVIGTEALLTIGCCTMDFNCRPR